MSVKRFWWRLAVPFLGVVLGFLAVEGVSAQAISAGKSALELAASPASYLGIDLDQLEASLCAAPPAPSTRDPKLVIANDGGQTGRVLSLEVSSAHGGTLIAVDVTPGSLAFVGPSPFVTACGGWDYRVTLDNGRLAPSSTLALLRNAPSDTSGVFTGVVQVPAAVELVPQLGGASQWRFYTLSLDLSGGWALALAPAGGRGAPLGSSNLVLFAQKSGASWVKGAQPAVQRSLEETAAGQLMLEATDAGIVSLNPAQR